MNTLLLDLGNTALKWSTPQSIDTPFTFVHNSSGLISKNVVKQWEKEKYTIAYGSTVASEWIVHGIKQELKKLSIDCHWLQSENKYEGEFILENKYDYPHLLGADRWNAAIGAISLHPNEVLLVVHMGTASTVDAIVPSEKEYNYQFLGGRIAPGPAMMREGLARGTAHLPSAVGNYLDFPTNTIDAITTGIIDSQLGLVERALKIMLKQGLSPRILLAGGAASMVEPYISKEFEKVDVRHNLVLRGLAVRTQKTL